MSEAKGDSPIAKVVTGNAIGDSGSGGGVDGHAREGSVPMREDEGKPTGGVGVRTMAAERGGTGGTGGVERPVLMTSTNAPAAAKRCMGFRKLFLYVFFV